MASFKPKLEQTKKTQAKKRKLKDPNSKGEQGVSKSARFDASEDNGGPDKVLGGESSHELGESCPWRSLQLILSLQRRDLDTESKVKLAYDFVNSRAKEVDREEGFEAVSIARLLLFLNNWIQSLLISSGKTIKVGGSENEPRAKFSGSCLDAQCWCIFKFCLEKSLKLQVSLNFLRDLLQPICCVVRDASSLLNGKLPYMNKSLFTGDGFELYSVALDCVSQVFTSHGGISNANLDSWISTVATVLQAVQKIYVDNIDDGNSAAFFMQFSCVLLDPFAKFLRVRPCRKTGFQDFIDKLLEPLLHLLGVLNHQIDGSDSNSGWRRNLQNLVKEVLSYGLFHPAHVDGFLGLRSAEKYVASHDRETSDAKIAIISYHRHLFDRLEKFVSGKYVSTLGGMGELFHVFVDQVKLKIRVPLLCEGSRVIEKVECSEPLEEVPTSCLNAETRKGVFDFFVKILEPLIQDIASYVQANLDSRTLLLDIHGTLKSTNKLLCRFMHEKLYMLMEGTSRVACSSFLEVVFDTFMSFSTKVNQIWRQSHNVDEADNDCGKILKLIAKEAILALKYLLEIEYKVVRNDLLSLWLMVLSYIPPDIDLMGAPDQCSLAIEILDLASLLIKIYGELRQVDNTIFALSKAVRLFVSHKEQAKSVGMLLSSPKLRLAICNAIISIPEAQAGGCIRRLTEDISETLEWLKACSPPEGSGELNRRNGNISDFNLKAELLGRVLSEIYSLVLDSVTMTSGSSNAVKVSVEDLMTVIRPSMGSLVAQQPESLNLNEFIFFTLGKISKRGETRPGTSTFWVFVFFFHLYMSCRSLYRQAMSLVPPAVSRKMASAMGDLCTAYDGSDLLKRTDYTDVGYFFWIAQPSLSLLTVIQFCLDIYLQDGATNCSPLIYILHTMATQRLVDLNRQIECFEFLLETKNKLAQMELMDDAQSPSCKKSKKWKRRLKHLKEEAGGLTTFMTGYFIDANKQIPFENVSWDFNVCTVNSKTLPVALWWIICHNVDVWCSHADKRKLKMFLSLIIFNFSYHLRSTVGVVGPENITVSGQLVRATVYQISLELLRDTVLYDQWFVCRYFASAFYRIFKKSVLSIFCNLSGEVDFKSSPNWQEALSMLDDSSNVISGHKRVMHACSSAKNLISHSHEKIPEDCPKELSMCPINSMEIKTAQSLLDLLCWMPNGCLSSRSFSLYTTYILHLERLVVGSLLDFSYELYLENVYELVNLFLSCRRTLKHLAVASCDEKMKDGQSPLSQMLFEGPFLVLWLLKSVNAVVGLQHSLAEDNAAQIKDLLFSLIDHTSHVFLTLSKAQFKLTISYHVNTTKPYKNQVGSSCGQNSSIELDSCSDSSEYLAGWRSLVLVAKTLKEEVKRLHTPLKDSLCNKPRGGFVSAVELTKLSSTLSCIQGFLWGFACSIDDIKAEDGNGKIKLYQWKCVPMSELNICIDEFSDSIHFLSCMLLFEDNQQPENLYDGQVFPKSDEMNTPLAIKESSIEGVAIIRNNILHQQQQCKPGAVTRCAPSSDNINDPKPSCTQKKRKHSDNAVHAATVLAQSDSFQLQWLNRSFLQSLLEGENPEGAFLLRQLFIASSVILKLNFLINSTPLSSRLVPTLVGVSKFLLLKFSNMVDVPKPFSFVWLDGVLKYLEELGGHFHVIDPNSSKTMYHKLIDLQLRAIGRCISLQGKKATLASYETESSTKTLDAHIGLHAPSVSCRTYYLDEFKNRLRLSFRELIKKPSEMHLSSAMEILERALVGVQEDYPMFYQIRTGSVGGGKVSSFVAAGIDCLDLVLESVSGQKRLNVVKSHMQGMISGLFNIILHLHGPSIFYGTSLKDNGVTDPDSGAVILMSLEVLKRVCGKPALFQMESCHVAQSLRVPAMLFRVLLQLRPSKVPSSANFQLLVNYRYCKFASEASCTLDRKFTTCLYAACCRLLFSVLKHHKGECERCIALLEDSVSVLLHCLESEKADSVVMESEFSWEAPDGVISASFLRRIYEEIRQQKTVYGRHSCKFLSSYIWIKSNKGPLQTGIRSEIDEALRPGVFALVDACSEEDLQRLHTIFGEGSCRNNLSRLLQEYRRDFQYQGKV